jgi:hypothetical protein
LQPTPLETSKDRPQVARSQRTEWNVLDADGTLIIVLKNLNGTEAKQDPGTKWTIEAAEKHGPLWKVHVSKVEPGPDGPRGAVALFHGIAEVDEIKRIRKWVETEKIKVLNVGGPSENTLPGVGDWTYRFLTQLFDPRPA